MLTQLIRPITSGIIAAVGLGLILTACGGDTALEEDIRPMSEIISQSAATPTPQKVTAAPTTQPLEIAKPVSPLLPVSPLPTPQPEESVSMPPSNNLGKPLPGSEEALAAAIADLADQTGLPAAEIKLVSIEAVEWRDASLGCPQEGYMYAQVITPGYLIVLQTKNQTYQYHTDQKTNVVWCQNKKEQ